MHSCAAAERQRIAAGAVLRKGLEGHARTWGVPLNYLEPPLQGPHSDAWPPLSPNEMQQL